MWDGGEDKEKDIYILFNKPVSVNYLFGRRRITAVF